MLEDSEDEFNEFKEIQEEPLLSQVYLPGETFEDSSKEAVEKKDGESPDHPASSKSAPAQWTPSPVRHPDLSAGTGSRTSLRKRKAEDEDEEDLVWDSNYELSWEKARKIGKKMREDPNWWPGKGKSEEELLKLID